MFNFVEYVDDLVAVGHPREDALVMARAEIAKRKKHLIKSDKEFRNKEFEPEKEDPFKFFAQEK